MRNLALVALVGLFATGITRCEPDARADRDEDRSASAGAGCDCNDGQVCCDASCGLCAPTKAACMRQRCTSAASDAGKPASTSPGSSAAGTPAAVPPASADAGEPARPPASSSVTCGGIAGHGCPGLGRCADDATDSCDPKRGGADCGGVCICDAKAKCRAGQSWNADPDVCNCEGGDPTEQDAGSPGGGDPTEQVFCGGFAGVQCPGVGACIDDPADDCDPTRGGADCGGLCRCNPSSSCPSGSAFDASPAVCACGGAAGGSAGERCGAATCAKGQVCCNPSCGICTPPGGVCTQQFCG
jgi:hypothetical protein